MNFLSRFIRHQVMDNPDQPPEGVTDVPPSPSNDEEPPSPGLQRSGHHHVLSTCAVHVLASPACHIRPGNAGGGAYGDPAVSLFTVKPGGNIDYGPKLVHTLKNATKFGTLFAKVCSVSRVPFGWHEAAPCAPAVRSCSRSYPPTHPQ